jgi:Rer1 family
MWARMADDIIIAIPSMAGQIDSLCAAQMVQHPRPSFAVLHQDISGARLVYWYAFLRALVHHPKLIFWLTVAYSLGIYLLNLFLAFLQPKFDPSNEIIDNEMEDGTAGGLPTKQDEEFRPFIRRLPEFKFWYSATRAIVIGFVCTFFSIFDVPVFWPVLVVYWLILFTLTSKSQVMRMIYANNC